MATCFHRLRATCVAAAASIGLAALAHAQSTSLRHAELLRAAGVDTGKTIMLPQLPETTPAQFQAPVLVGGKRRVLVLRRHSMRSSDFKLLVDDGESIRAVPAGEDVSYRGHVQGLAKSVVAASLWNGQLHATIDDGQKVWVIQLTRALDATRAHAEHLVFDLRDSSRQRHRRFGSPVAAESSVPVLGGGSAQPRALRVAEVAIEADYRFYQRNGRSVSNTQRDVTSVMNAVAAIFRRDIEIDYKITGILVRTSTDPYTSSSPNTLLAQFRSWWNGNQLSLRRDVAHLFTGRNLSGNFIGVAYLGVICTSSGYGLSESRFTSNFGARVGLTAHELGHNWGAPHCSGSDCRIMCPTLGGCSRDFSRFGSVAKARMISHKNSRNCLDSAAPPVINTMTPSSISSYGGDLVTLKGTNLRDVTSVSVGTQSVPSCSSPTLLRFSFECLGRRPSVRSTWSRARRR